MTLRFALRIAKEHPNSNEIFAICAEIGWRDTC